ELGAQSKILRSAPCFPGCPAACPEALEQVALPHGVHRLPEAVVMEPAEFIAAGEALEWRQLPTRRIALDEIEHPGREHEEAPIDPSAVARRLPGEARGPLALQDGGAEGTGRSHHRHGRELAMSAMKRDLLGDIDVGETVAVGHAERLVIREASRDPLE